MHSPPGCWLGGPPGGMPSSFQRGGYGRLPEPPGSDAEEWSEPWPEDQDCMSAPAPLPLPPQPVQDWAEILVPARQLVHYAFTSLGGQPQPVLGVQPGPAAGQLQVTLPGQTLTLAVDQPVAAALPRAIRARDLRENQTVTGPWQMPLSATRVQLGETVRFELLGAELILQVSAAPDEWIEIP